MTESAPSDRLRAALEHPDASARLEAALAAGTRPDDSYVVELVARCAVEPDFFVRDMLTWALTRHDPSRAVEVLLPEVTSEIPQARSQALHTLSKIGDPIAFAAITPAVLRDPHPEVARAAWRTASGLVPEGAQEDLADELATQFGRGDHETQRSLSRAFAAIGFRAEGAIERATVSPYDVISAHARATAIVMGDPDTDFAEAAVEARRVVAKRALPRD
ncbi:HEAT repeat-containing protein [Microbacterium testaceum]|jgi:HEAT repeat protein|uniref:HEAT repeat-containing protein n=1 Tax=Microbacterium testaceum TaxID=2033 RepID=A0A147FCJ4_MICTE|nr:MULTISPECIES: HEAT repeat domain-containing protein [Microbacterium]KTS14312.1 HEAT repeat-containing protein [Microbacterium testaceum]KTS64800.1 HEAT repeat-containing protein [Microbacterium testaceum]KTS84834.1 HEAT repeat-containing protein [Microbacterium testaceum]MDF2048292.1 HEAT repeat domain-containing protein [Microbacterium sp. Kw_RZR3]